MKKRILALVLAVCLVVGGMPLQAVATSPHVSTWDGVSTDKSWYTSSTATNYTISTGAQLAGLAELVRDGRTFADKTIFLTSNIDLDNHEWTPIGLDSYHFAFRGNFQGNNHVIENLYQDIYNAYGGLFGYVLQGSIENISVTGSVSTEDNPELYGIYPVGGIVACLDKESLIQNCSFEGNIYGDYNVGGIVGQNGGQVINCSFDGEVTASESTCGGIAGLNQGAIRLCHSSGVIEAIGEIENGIKVNGGQSGGIAGSSCGRIEECYNTGVVSGQTSEVGGIVGTAISLGDSSGAVALAIENSYNTGTIIGRKDNYSYGGVVGNVTVNSTQSIEITNCYSFSKLTSPLTAGGLIADSIDRFTTSNCFFLSVDGDTSNGAISNSDFEKQDTFTGWDFSTVWEMSETLHRPILRNNKEIGGGGDIPVIPDDPDTPAKIIGLYPENGKVLDKDNPESGTSTTNYADGKLRIFFDKQLKNAGGNRPELDTGVGTLEIHRASDDAVVYQIKSNTEMPFWGENGVWDKAVRLDNATAALDYDTEYYVTMPAGFIQFADGSASPAIAKGQWGFRTAKLGKPVLKLDDGAIKFKFTSDIVDGKDIEYDFCSYDESWFFKDSTVYNHDLVKASIRGAMAAYGADGEKSTDRNINALMNDLKFRNIETSYPIPQINSIGYAIGSKNLISDKGEEASLLMVAIRGGNYHAEWGGNFNVGWEENHRGFDTAAKEVFTGIQTYIKRYSKKLYPNIKVWIMGYSRGGATTNLVASYLDQEKISAVNPKDVYAFCFECPQPTRDINSDASKYDNITSIVNPIDLVPKVAMSDWGYRRYGKTYFLPFEEGVDGIKYNELFYNMRSEYINLLKNCSDTPADLYNKLVPSTFAQSEKGDIIARELALQFSDPETYYKLYQSDLVSLIAEKLGGYHNSGERFKIVLDTMKEVETGIIVLVTYLVEFNFNYKDGGLAHYAELCLSWIDSLKGQYTYVSPKYRRVLINCPVNVSVYNSSNTLVGSITDDEIQEVENGIVAYIDYNGQKNLCLPNKEQYRIELEATDSGTVTYTATEYNMDSGKTEKVVSYYEVDVEKGDTLTGTAENLDSEAGKYPLTLNGGTPLTPTINQSGSAVREYTVNVTASGNGTVTGGGHFVGGEFSKVTATAKSGEDFLGWYVGGQLISSDAEYRFLVDKQTDLVGKFTQNQSPSIPPAAKYYEITTPTTQNGTVTATPQSSCEGGTVTITATPDAGYQLDMLTVKDSAGSEITLTDQGSGKYTFTMPASKVSISAAFKPLQTEHKIQIDRIKNGVVMVEPKLAIAGEEITLTVQPDAGCQLVKLTALDKDGKEISMVNPAESKFTFIMPDSDVTIQAEFKAVWKNPYSDVSEKAWYYGNVRYVTEQGIMHGYDNGKFGPDDELNRAQMTQLLYNKEGKPGAPANIKYNDVTSGSWYAQAVAWADSRNIVNGYGAGKFGPSDPITREQLAAILYRYAGSPKTNGKLDRFSDAEEVSAYAADAMRWAVESGLVKGSGDSLNPKGRATRKEVAAIMQRYLEG